MKLHSTLALALGRIKLAGYYAPQTWQQGLNAPNPPKGLPGVYHAPNPPHGLGVYHAPNNPNQFAQTVAALKPAPSAPPAPPTPVPQIPMPGDSAGLAALGGMPNGFIPPPPQIEQAPANGFIPPPPELAQSLQAPRYTPAHLAAFRRATGTNFNPNSRMDRFNMSAIRGGGTTQSRAQFQQVANDTAAANPYKTAAAIGRIKLATQAQGLGFSPELMQGFAAQQPPNKLMAALGNIFSPKVTSGIGNVASKWRGHLHGRWGRGLGALGLGSGGYKLKDWFGDSESKAEGFGIGNRKGMIDATQAIHGDLGNASWLDRLRNKPLDRVGELLAGLQGAKTASEQEVDEPEKYRKRRALALVLGSSALGAGVGGYAAGGKGALVGGGLGAGAGLLMNKLHGVVGIDPLANDLSREGVDPETAKKLHRRRQLMSLLGSTLTGSGFGAISGWRRNGGAKDIAIGAGVGTLAGAGIGGASLGLHGLLGLDPITGGAAHYARPKTQ